MSAFDEVVRIMQLLEYVQLWVSAFFNAPVNDADVRISNEASDVFSTCDCKTKEHGSDQHMRLIPSFLKSSDLDRNQLNDE